MILMIRKRKGLTYKQFWFARKCKLMGAFGLTAYRQFIGKKVPGFPFVKHTQYTSLIDLTLTNDQILAGMNKNMRSQLRKAENDGFIWEEEKDVEAFRIFFNHFASEKGLPPLERKILASQIPYLFIGKISWQGKLLAAHSYLVDREESRARFLNGGSIRLEEKLDAALIGRANRLCHFLEMGKLREMGIKTFDFGGFSVNTTDPQKLGIRQFKEAFGGKVTEESSYISPLYALAELLKGKK